ncbi:MAG: hypothetical protein AAFP79_17170 [Pseudomonadota bacterium]
MVKALAPALAALIPLMLGTTPHEASAKGITVALCNGGEITLDLGQDKNEPERDCHSKGCHAGSCREKGKTKRNGPT